jgi:hypothetical protein
MFPFKLQKQVMSRPFQCLSYVLRKDQGKDDILVAASGSHICFFDITSGILVSLWSSEQDHQDPFNKVTDANAQKPKESPPNETVHLDSLRPPKRLKVSSPLDEFAGFSADPLKGGRILNAELPKDPRHSTAVIKLTGTHDGRYVIAVTDDKCIRVVEILSDNTSKQLSARYVFGLKSLLADADLLEGQC